MGWPYQMGIPLSHYIYSPFLQVRSQSICPWNIIDVCLILNGITFTTLQKMYSSSKLPLFSSLLHCSPISCCIQSGYREHMLLSLVNFHIHVLRDPPSNALNFFPQIMYFDQTQWFLIFFFFSFFFSCWLTPFLKMQGLKLAAEAILKWKCSKITSQFFSTTHHFSSSVILMIQTQAMIFWQLQGWCRKREEQPNRRESAGVQQ